MSKRRTAHNEKGQKTKKKTTSLSLLTHIHYTINGAQSLLDDSHSHIWMGPTVSFHHAINIDD